MLLANILTFLLLLLPVANAVIDHRSETTSKARTRAKIGTAILSVALGGVAIAANSISAAAVARAKAEADARNQAAETARAESEKKFLAEQAEHGKATRIATEQAQLACAEALRSGQSLQDYIEGLSPAQRAVLRSSGSGPIPQWRFGGAQIRLFTVASETEAHDRRAHLMNTLLHVPDQNWTTHVTPPTKSIPTRGKQRGHHVWVVTLNQIDGALKDAVCTWLASVGIPPGLETCDVRDLAVALDALGKWVNAPKD